MPGLEDIGEQEWTLTVGKTPITGGGLSAHHIMYLMDRFPLVSILFGSTEGLADKLKDKLGDPMSIIKSAPDAVCAAFAIATGYEPGDKKAEKAASRLSLITQVKLLQKIIEATIGEGGVGPFVAMLGNLTKTITIPTPQSEDPKAPASTSPPRSPAALHLELPPQKRGPTRRVA